MIIYPDREIPGALEKAVWGCPEMAVVTVEIALD